MSYTKRNDGRKFDETRPIEAKVGVIKNADGSAYFKIGKQQLMQQFMVQGEYTQNSCRIQRTGN